MSFNPKQMGEKIPKVITAWETLAPDAVLGGLTLAKFKAKVQPSIDVRTEIAGLDSQRRLAVERRGPVDQDSNEAIQMLVNSVKGDADYGPDSALYAAFGYVRKSERKIGARKKATGNQTQPAS